MRISPQIYASIRNDMRVLVLRKTIFIFISRGKISPNFFQNLCFFMSSVRTAEGFIPTFRHCAYLKCRLRMFDKKNSKSNLSVFKQFGSSLRIFYFSLREMAREIDFFFDTDSTYSKHMKRPPPNSLIDFYVTLFSSMMRSLRIGVKKYMWRHDRKRGGGQPPVRNKICGFF